jgi:hypothetical protein
MKGKAQQNNPTSLVMNESLEGHTGKKNFILILFIVVLRFQVLILIF